jgi:hypothetical protein
MDVVVVLIKCLLCCKMIKIVFLIVESGKKISVFKTIRPTIKNLQIDLFYLGLVAIVRSFCQQLSNNRSCCSVN